MHFSSSFLALALAASSTSVSASAIPGNRVSSDVMLAMDYPNAATCGQKNPAINMAIQAYCRRDNLVVGTPFARGGMRHNGIKVKIVGNNCPADSRWIPGNYCDAQFHYLCANMAGPNGQGWMRFGANNCQTWVIQHHN